MHALAHPSHLVSPGCVKFTFSPCQKVSNNLILSETAGEAGRTWNSAWSLVASCWQPFCGFLWGLQAVLYPLWWLQGTWTNGYLQERTEQCVPFSFLFSQEGSVKGISVLLPLCCLPESLECHFLLLIWRLPGKNKECPFSVGCMRIRGKCCWHRDMTGHL